MIHTVTPTARNARLRRRLPALMGLVVALPLAGPALAQPTHVLDGDGNLVQLEAPDPATPDGQLQLIRRKLVAGEAKQAEREVGDWIDQYPLHPLLPEAYLIQGDAVAARGYYYLSLKSYEAIINLYPGTEQYRTALEREYDIAKLFVGGLARKSEWFGIRVLSQEDEGVELLIRVQERLPGSDLGERASIAIGDYYFDQGSMEMASEAYDVFLLNYPDSAQREWAMLRLIQASLAKYKGPEFDPSGLTDAAQRLREYMREFPSAAEQIGAKEMMLRINESLAEKKLVTARWYEKRGMERGAITLYRRAVLDYPQSTAAVEALAELEERGVPLIDPRDPTAEQRGNRPDEGNAEPAIRPGGADDR